MGVLANLARVFTTRQKINPAGEGNYHAGPYHLRDGWLPHEWGQYWNFWQMDLDPLPYPGCSIVEACVWAYVRAIAQLPGYHIREKENGGTEIVNSSALSRVLRVPNGYQTPSDFLVHLISSLLYTGNSYWLAARNDRNEISALHWTDPRQCQVREATVDGQQSREVFYEILEPPLQDFSAFGSRSLIVPARDVLHIKLKTPRHPLVGVTWLQALAPELAARLAINKSALAFSGNMSRPSGVLQTDLTLTKAQIDELREIWNEHAKGMNAGGVPILSRGLKFNPVSVSNVDAQIVDQLKLNDRAVAAVFGVPPMIVGLADSGSVKSAEAQMAEWLAAGLGWLINHIEKSFDQFFGLDMVPAGREWCQFDEKTLLRTNFKERVEAEVRGVQGGIFAPNEAREFEGLPPVKAGDEPRVQQQLLPLSAVVEPPKPAAPAAPAIAEPTSDAPEDDGEATRALLAYRLRKHVRDHAKAA